MTENHPSTSPTAAEPVDLYTWGRDFNGIRPRGTEDERPRLTHAVARVATAISWHINGKTGTATLSTRRIAKAAQVSTGTVSTAIETLEAVGWFSVSRSKRAGTDYDAAHTYRLTSPIAALRKARAAAESSEVNPDASTTEAYMPQPLRHDASTTEAELRSLTTSLTTRDEKISVRAGAPTPKSVDKSVDRKRRDGYETAEAWPLHPEWTPNNSNRAEAVKLGLDVETVAAAFRRAMNAWGQRRTEWGSAFTEYLREVAEDNASNTFVAVEDDDVVAQAVESAVETLKADQTPASAPVVNPWGDPFEPAPEVAPVIADGDGHTYEADLVDLAAAADEPIDAEVVELAGPGVAGYPPEVEHVITRAEGIVRADGGDYFTRDERVRAAELAQQGATFATIAGEIDQDRARAAVRMGGAA